MKTGCKVMQAMANRPVYASPDTSVEECAALMAKNKVGALLVMDKEALVGILAERDIVRKVTAQGHDPKKKKTEDAMIRNVITIEPDKDVHDALIKMRDHDVKYLPVVDGKKTLGILSVKDALRIQPQLFELMVEKMDLKRDNDSPINNIRDSDGVCQSCGSFSSKLFDIDGALVCGKCR